MDWHVELAELMGHAAPYAVSENPETAAVGMRVLQLAQAEYARLTQNDTDALLAADESFVGVCDQRRAEWIDHMEAIENSSVTG